MRRQLIVFFRRLNRRRRLAAGRKKDAPPPSLVRRLRGAAVYCASLVAIVSAVFLLGEFLLLAAFALTGLDSLKTLDEDDSYTLQLDPPYPGDPENWTKIAIFGGSTAQGALSERPFSDVLKFDLKQRYPGRNIFVKNYAMQGYPFHRHQAEYVKLLIDKYDVIIIYCGNNEAENYFDDKGYWRKEGFKDAKDLAFRRPAESRSPVMSLLERHSRIFAAVTRAKGGLIQGQAPGNKYRAADFKEIEDEDALPAKERKQIVDNFERDLEEICQLATAGNKQVVIAVTATNETWPPLDSCFSVGTTQDQKRQWREIYDSGMQLVAEKQYEQALPVFEEARQIDSGVAILNYRIGICHLELGETETARPYLRQAIDQDGFYSRSISALHKKARELSQKHACLHNVDMVARMHQVLDAGISNEELYADHCHMRLLGHVIVGRTFLDRLGQLEPFRSWRPPVVNSADERDWRALSQTYLAKLGVSKMNEASTALGRAEFHFKMAYWTAYPEACYDEAEIQINRLADLHDGRTPSRAVVKMCQARLALRREQYELATQRINEALGLENKVVQGIMQQGVFHEFVHEEFARAGITFSQEKKFFEWTPKNATPK